MTSVTELVPRSRPNGWWGMLIFVAAEATLFGCLLGSWFYLRLLSVHWPQGGIEPKDPVVPLSLAAALASTSLLMQLATSAGLRGRAEAAAAPLVLALVVQAGYFAYAVHDFRADLVTFSPQDNAYASIYYTLLGADHAHVALGLLLNAWVLLRLLGGLTPYRLTGLRASTLYWHVVNAITVLVTVTIVSA
ncbi:MAG TPA: cytochrome c oxidase subunit 3 [Gaiellaceae bacterium]|jgi:heme/copper-type cytochrome/quinol oxidase subunit 3|nr:cytochrome c oxidase subunit 3 [Gaiellaceae bacterium]